MAISCCENVLMVGSPCKVVEMCEYTGLRAVQVYDTYAHIYVDKGVLEQNRGHATLHIDIE